MRCSIKYEYNKATIFVLNSTVLGWMFKNQDVALAPILHRTSPWSRVRKCLMIVFITKYNTLVHMLSRHTSRRVKIIEEQIFNTVYPLYICSLTNLATGSAVRLFIECAAVRVSSTVIVNSCVVSPIPLLPPFTLSVICNCNSYLFVL